VPVVLPEIVMLTGITVFPLRWSKVGLVVVTLDTVVLPSLRLLHVTPPSVEICH
jgi:hypothetical protein